MPRGTPARPTSPSPSTWPTRSSWRGPTTGGASTPAPPAVVCATWRSAPSGGAAGPARRRCPRGAPGCAGGRPCAEEDPSSSSAAPVGRRPGAQLGGQDRRLRAALEAELGQQVGDVVLDRLLGEEHALADLPVRQPLTDQLQH